MVVSTGRIPGKGHTWRAVWTWPVAKNHRLDGGGGASRILRNVMEFSVGLGSGWAAALENSANGTPKLNLHWAQREVIGTMRGRGRKKVSKPAGKMQHTSSADQNAPWFAMPEGLWETPRQAPQIPLSCSLALAALEVPVSQLSDPRAGKKFTTTRST